MSGHPPLGVLLLYLGGPDGEAAVRPFLRNLFADREIIRFPGGALGQWLLARLVSARRAPLTAARYREMGGYPLLPNALQQARGLERELERRLPGQSVLVRPAFRYWHPFAGEALAELAGAGVQELVAVTLYPQFSATTTGSSLTDLQRALADRPPPASLRVVDRFSAAPRYRQLLLARIVEALDRWPASARDEVLVLFTAHSVPLSFLERGDPYQREIEDLQRWLVAHLPARGVSAVPPQLAYQSRSGPVRWLGPELLTVARERIAAGQREILLVPLSFVSDHLETLHELDIEVKQELVTAGATRVERIRAFNDDPEFIALLADLVLTADEDGAELASLARDG